jgi:hypothetical protein
VKTTTSDLPPDATPHDHARICYANRYLCSYVTPDDGQGKPPKRVEFPE